MPASASPRQRPTRLRLLDAAAELLWLRSFHASSTDDICARARVRKGSFYHYFPSKTDLAAAAILAAWARVRADVFEAVLRGSGSGLQKLARLTAAVDRLQREHHHREHVYLGCPFGALGQEMAHQDPRIQAAVDQVFEEHCDLFQRALEQALSEGAIRAGHLRERARAVLALMEGALLVAKVANAPSRFTAIARAVPVLAAADPPPRS